MIARFYMDRFGRMSRDNTCHECVRRRERISEGAVARSESKSPKVKKAIEAEVIAEKHFKKLGFKVRRTDCLGPDLICRIGKITWTVEVKRARATQPKSYPNGSHIIDKVHPRRLNDDLIAFVLPNGRVYIESMKIHLSKCNKSGGARTVTAIVKEFGMPIPFDKTKDRPQN